MNVFKPFTVALLIFLAGINAARAQYSENIVGYVNHPFFTGNNLFGNPLSNPPDRLSTILNGVPNGSTVSLWNPATQQFGAASTFTEGSGWSVDYEVQPGYGALFQAPSLFTNTFVGTVLTGPGPNEVNPPPPLDYGPGLHLVSSLFPAEDRTFFDLIGRNPVHREYVTFLDPETQTYSTTTFRFGHWNNGVPTLDIGEAAFFNLGPVPVPEPAAVGLLGVALVAVLVRRRALAGRQDFEPRSGT